MRLKDKNVLVTGATSGIGRAIAIRCAQEGAHLMITYARNLIEIQKTQKIIENLGKRCVIQELDLSEPDNIPAMLNAIQQFGKLHVLVNNAGIVHREAFTHITNEQYSTVVDTNLKGTFFLTQAVANVMIAQGEGGSIINISSISDEILSPNLSHYQISKAGVSMLTKSAAYELAKHRIRVNTISPGLVKTEMNRDQWEKNPEVWKNRAKHIPLGRTGTPEDIASAVIFLASDEASWITGTRIEVDGGSHL